MSYTHKMVNGIKEDLTPEEIQELNARDALFEANILEYAKVAYMDKRKEEYNKRGATQEAMNVALWERIMENSPEYSDALQIIREAVKQEIPKPDDEKI